jgi:transposase
MAGRKTKYTPETVNKIVQALKMGATHELACNYAGIGVSTFHDWMSAKPEFSEAVKEAEGAAAVGWLAKIEKAANEGTWQAAAWKLERRYPREYGRTVVTQEQSLTPEQLEAMSDDELDRYIAKLSKLASR